MTVRMRLDQIVSMHVNVDCISGRRIIFMALFKVHTPLIIIVQLSVVILFLTVTNIGIIVIYEFVHLRNAGIIVAVSIGILLGIFIGMILLLTVHCARHRCVYRLNELSYIIITNNNNRIYFRGHVAPPFKFQPSAISVSFVSRWFLYNIYYVW